MMMMIIDDDFDYDDDYDDYLAQPNQRLPFPMDEQYLFIIISV